MSIKTTYKCNLCHTEYERPTDLKAYYWGILPETKTVMGYQLVDKIDASGTHICNKCINYLKTALKCSPA
jgi:hypothetical protein